MPDFSHSTPLEPAYPSRLRTLADAPASLTSRGGPVESAHTVAVVGSRAACRDALDFAGDLASALVGAGAVVVSGGALGVDAAAHEGALRAKGRTWAIAGTGHLHCFPATNADLFERIGHGPGAMVWPFAPDYQHRNGFLVRNRVLVALSDAVVVVQAGEPSGALHAASWARKLDKPLWVVPAPPWMDDFAGCRSLIDQGAQPLTSIDRLLGAMGLGATLPAAAASDPDAPLAGDPDAPMPVLPLSAEGLAVLGVTSDTPLHVDAVASRAALTAQAAWAALLTLALENVVVEGPPGFFRRPKAHKR